MALEWRRNRFVEQSDMLLWKLAYYVHEGDGPLRQQFSKLKSEEKAKVFADYTGFVRSFVSLSAIDDEPSDSETSSFFSRVAQLYCGISFCCEPLKYGTYSASLGILTCCLKNEGWAPLRDEADESMAEFRASIHAIKATCDQRVENVVNSIKQNWEFTSFPDTTGFKTVADFKHRMLGNNRSLDSLFA